ncbi:MAG: MBL fold metallo-hydrolase [Burkholderiales bacterium]|nr:MBL fold metallo-hydrolase [Phycisphaerae bacterium]
MRLQFLGACRTVTGSSHLLEINGKQILLDCGMYQGRRDEARQFNEWVPDVVRDVDAIILSHGHLDHCGKLPVLTRSGLNIPIYCTEATADVARVVMLDAGEIQQEDAEHLNRRDRRPGEPEFRPLYTTSDVHQTMRLINPVRYGQSIDIGGAKITLFDAGHILGSGYVTVEWQERNTPRSLLFTADIGRVQSPIIRDPAPLNGAFDYVITESTYGGRTHGPIAEIEPQLLDAVQSTIQRRSRLIVPSFALGRTQTVLWYMHKFMKEQKIPPINVYVDSPMGSEMTEVHEKLRDYYDDETAQLIGKEDLFADKRITLASSSAQSRQINSDRGPCVIIASSPTCEFGRVLHHLERSLENRNDTILFVGFTPYNTLGRRLQDGSKRVRVFNRFYNVAAEVRTIHGLSAHADGQELAAFLAPTCKPGTQAFVVHGEVDQAETVGRTLVERGMGRAAVPALETTFIA